MNISARLFNLEKDFSIIEDFCKKRQLPIIDKDLLSAYGVVVFIDNNPVVCGWLYPVLTSKLCIVENIISDLDVKNKTEYINLLYTTFHLIAKDMGYKYIKTTVENKSMKNRLESYGYMNTQENLTNYIGVI